MAGRTGDTASMVFRPCCVRVMVVQSMGATVENFGGNVLGGETQKFIRSIVRYVRADKLELLELCVRWI